MGTTALDKRPVSPPPARRFRYGRAIGIAVAVLVVGVVVLGLLVLRALSRPIPEFPSLADQPDRALHGTVAYFDDQSGCVQIVAAAGRPARTVLCLPLRQEASAAAKLGKLIGPQLVWRPDGRLEVTMFRMTTPGGPGFTAGWQKVVDVRTGQVEDVPAADVPSTPNRTTHPTVSPGGQRIVTSSDEQSGRVTVTLVDRSGSRTLLSAQGPPSYSYRLYSAFWAPNWQWIAADDGRILVITPGHPAVTRVLTTDSDRVAFGGDDPRLARFAVTAADILTAAR